ncbi:MAG TPA: undecaprenyl-diphosphate phosphatase [Solirubrobacteraceae bacterium]
MSALEAIVLGIVQGLTEYLPISSTAHLRIVPALAGWKDPGAAFTAVVQLGTMAAVLVYFRHELVLLFHAFIGSLRDRSLWRSEDTEARLGWYLIIGTIPVAVLGLAFNHVIEHQLRSLELIGAVMVIVSLVLYTADRAGTRERQLPEITLRDGVTIGFAQAAALIPGVSRSGATISMGLFRNFTRQSATRYSFLLSIPAVVLSGLFELRKIGGGSNHAGVAPTIIATIFAFIFGYLTIAWLLRYVRTHNFNIFVIYRVIVGLLVIGLAASNTIK